MLAIVTIFLSTLLTSFVAVWLYRKVSGWHGFKQPVVGRSNRTFSMQLKPQQGYISLVPSSHDRARRVRFNNLKDGIRAPWGW